MSKAVLVTGAKGFIGRETVRQLERQGWQVLPAVRCPEGRNDVQLDLEDPGFPLKMLNLPRVDAIVHLAARVDFAGTVADMYIPNVAATASLLALAKRWNASFVFASTALMAGSDMVEIGPQMRANPNAPYMQSKWLAERLIEASGVRSTTLRIGGVFGLDGPGHLGLNRAIGAVVAGSRPRMVGSGRAKRNYVYVKDVAASIVRVLDEDISGIHLVAGKEVLSVAEMLQALCNAFLPGQTPDRVEGLESADQVIQPSGRLTVSHGFRDAVADMLLDVRQ